MGFSTGFFAYLGPETMLPVTSAVAGAVGVFLMFGKSSLRWLIQAGRKLTGRADSRPRPGIAGHRKIGAGPVGRVAPRVAKRKNSA